MDPPTYATLERNLESMIRALDYFNQRILPAAAAQSPEKVHKALKHSIPAERRYGKRIDQLIERAKANANRNHVAVALKSVADVLALDPKNSTALGLQRQLVIYSANTWLDRAAAEVKHIDNYVHRSMAYASLAEAQAEVGLIEQAKSSAKLAIMQVDRDRAYLAIARAHAKAGELQDASTMAGKTSDPQRSHGIQRAIAHRLAVAGRITEAVTIAKGTANPQWQSDTFADIVLGVIEARRLTDAASVAKLIREPLTRTRAFAQVAVAQAEAGNHNDYEALLKLAAESIDRNAEAKLQVRQWIEIAHAKQSIGDRKGAMAILTRAEAMTPNVASDGARLEILAVIATGYRAAGDADRYRSLMSSTVDRIAQLPNRFERITVSKSVARARAMAGDWQGGLAMVRQHASAAHRAEVLPTLGQAMAGADVFDAIDEWLDANDPALDRASLMLGIAMDLGRK